MTALILAGVGVIAVISGAWLACMWVAATLDDEYERRRSDD